MGRTQVHSAKHQVAQQQQQLQSAKTKQAQQPMPAASARPQSAQAKSQQQQQQRAQSPQNSNKQQKQLQANNTSGNATKTQARPQSPSGQHQQTKLSVNAQPFYPRNMQPTQTMGKPQNSTFTAQSSSRPQSAQVQCQQPQSKQPSQQQQRVQSANPMSHAKQQQNQRQNAQVYRPTPVKEHPDDAFLSGAWLFDTSRVPQWMSARLPKHAPSHSQQQRATQSASIVKQQPNSNKTVTNVNASVIKVGSIKAKNASPDDAFFSGAWLFDASVAPQWLSSQLPVQQKHAAQQAKQQPSKQQQQSNNNKRPQSPRR